MANKLGLGAIVRPRAQGRKQPICAADSAGKAECPLSLNNELMTNIVSNYMIILARMQGHREAASLLRDHCWSTPSFR